MNFAGHHNRSQRAAGATLLEIALALPFTLLGLFFLIWVGLTIHAKTSLDAAVTRALRLASTRGVDELLGVEVISDVQRWNDGVATTRLPQLLSRNVNWSEAQDYYKKLLLNVFAVYDDEGQPKEIEGLYNMPPEYIYALVYINEAMRQSIGEQIRYPCDPSNLEEGQGCMACSFLNPSTDQEHGMQPGFDAAHIFRAAGTSVPPPRRRIGVECRFQPSHILLSPIVALLRIIAGQASMPLIVLRRRMFFDIPEF